MAEPSKSGSYKITVVMCEPGDYLTDVTKATKVRIKNFIILVAVVGYAGQVLTVFIR